MNKTEALEVLSKFIMNLHNHQMYLEAYGLDLAEAESALATLQTSDVQLFAESSSGVIRQFRVKQIKSGFTISDGQEMMPFIGVGFEEDETLFVSTFSASINAEWENY